MQVSSSTARPSLVGLGDTDIATGDSTSSVSWAPIFAGALISIALSVVLIALGSGLGLLSVSPWSNAGASAATFTIMTALWFIVVQWLSAAFGGYLTGRLRSRWVQVHTDEVFFRDTAHGLLAWALATVAVIAITAVMASSLIGGGARAVSTVASGAALGASAGAAGNQSNTGPSGSSGGMAYFTDTLFRSDNPSADTNPQASRAEASRILIADIKNGDVSPADRTYLAKLVAVRTGLSQEDAEKRVDDVVAMVKQAETKAREAADAARKASAYMSLFTALSMAIGAFIAAAAAALGGHHRDEWELHLYGQR